MNEQKQPSSPKKQPNSYIRYSGMGIMMVVIMGGGTYAGVLLDQKLGLKFPVFTIVLAMVSVGVAIWYFIKDFLKK